MFTASEIDVFSLPSVPIKLRLTLPSVTGIYFVIDRFNVVRYIGLSRNIRTRWYAGAHHVFDYLSKEDGAKIAYLEITDVSLLKTAEVVFIKHFKPDLNKSNGGQMGAKEIQDGLTNPRIRYNRSHPESLQKAESNRKANYRSASIRFHKENDADLIQWLESQDGTFQDAIKAALYDSFRRKNKSKKDR